MVLGVVLYMGVVSLIGNGLFDRLKLLVTDPDQYPLTSYVRKVRMSNIFLWTIYQMVILVVLVVVTFSPVAVLFPLLIAALPLFRCLAERIFPSLTAEDCKVLDCDEDIDEATMEIDSIR